MAPLTNHLLAVKYTISGSGLIPTSNTDATTKFEKYASQIVGVLSLIAVIFFVIQIIFSGYAFLSSEGDPKKMETARDHLTSSVMGLFIVIVSVAIGTLISKLAGLNNPLDIDTMFTNMGL